MAYKPPSDPAKAAKKKEQVLARLKKKSEKKAKQQERKAKKLLKEKEEGGGKKGLSSLSIKKPSLKKNKVTPGAQKEPKKPKEGATGLKKIDLFGKDAKAKNAVLEEEKAALESKNADLEGRMRNMSMNNQRAKQIMQQAMTKLN